jgi:hypothetical protein
LYIGGSKAKRRFKLLHAQKEQVEAEFGYPLDWRELPQKKASRILFLRQDSDMEDRETWPEQHAWLAEMLENIVRVLKPRVMALPSFSGDEAGA